MDYEALKGRLMLIEREQAALEKRTIEGVDSGVGVHCNFLQWAKLYVEYFSVYNLIKNFNNKGQK